jgi:methylmalonyl-CoA mutase N-terminal domain/subunit
MFDEKTLNEVKDLEGKWQKQCSQRYPGLKSGATTYSGFPVKPVYTPADIKDMDYSDIGMPGQYPYTRAVYPLTYQTVPWMNLQIMGLDLPEDLRRRHDALVQEGMKGHLDMDVIYLGCDIASQAGYDPDDPRAHGRVGSAGCGYSIATGEDYVPLLEGLDLTKTYVNINHFDNIYATFPMYIVYAESQGYSRQQLRGGTQNNSYKQWFWDVASFPPRSYFKLAVDLIKFCTKEMPRWNHTNLTGYNPQEMGATPVQELAFTLAVGVVLIEECVKAGLKPDEFVPRFSFHLAFGNDFFENIAKFRALRRMWAKITKERFGCENPRSHQARIFMQTAGSTLTYQQPKNNIVRATIQTLGAVLAGVDAVDVCCYDEAYTIPTEESAVMALRTQQIILHETKIPNVTDPLGGSYYLEWLTNKIEEEAYKLISKVEELGGYIKCWESGWFKEECLRSGMKWRDDVESGKEVVVGVNKYVMAEEAPISYFEGDPEVEKTAIERVRAYRARRDSEKTKSALAKLREETKRLNEGDGYLMPVIIDTARDHATLGEIMSVLKEELGWGYVY